MTIYIATANNLYFYQNLAVEADSRQEAYDKFRAYLDEPDQKNAEQYELEQAEKLGIYEEGDRELQRESYIYSVDFQGVEIPDSVDGYGDIGTSVVMTGSGGNG